MYVLVWWNPRRPGSHLPEKPTRGRIELHWNTERIKRERRFHELRKGTRIHPAEPPLGGNYITLVGQL